MQQPLFLSPVFQEKIWGGTQLHTRFNYTLPKAKIGECWAISAHPHGVCTVLNGQFQGQRLDTLWQEHRELFGNAEGNEFPLLTKILDAADDLSVQVHPDDTYGKKHAGELGKTESWYIIDAEPNAEIVYGHHAKTRAELEQMIHAGRWKALLRSVKVKKGDFFFVPSGTIHAIGKGILILETQQSSDTTYRVYDYDRKDDHGQPRELHIQQSIDVTQVPQQDPILHVVQEHQGDSIVTTFLKTPFFNVYCWQVQGDLHLTQQSLFTLVSVMDGIGQLWVTEEDKETAYPLQKGMHFILPHGIRAWRLEGELELIASEPGMA